MSVIVPCRNERDYLEPFLKSLLHQQAGELTIEYLIADGMSDDGSREFLETFSCAHPQVRLIDNPGRIVSTGLNAALKAAQGDTIIRMDMHTVYASDYIAQCVRELERTDADNVGGPALARSKTYLQAAISLAYHSRFSTGGARFHNPAYEGPADTVPYGCWKREVFEKVGMFDEELVRNQDDEHNLRILRAGGKVWQTPRIVSWYYPRGSIRGLFCQYAQYGYWKVRVIQKHRLPASWRHLVPGLFVMTVAVLTVLAPFFRLAFWMWALLLGAYLFGTLAASLITSLGKGKFKYLPVLPFIFTAYHFGYGYGFARGMIDFLLLRKRGSATFSRLTRRSKAPLTS